MDSAKQQLADKLKSANNILVTVSRDPSVDQLAACLGLTLLLNKQGKHSVAVFSGKVPSTIEFLKPEETIEKNTDSLRDFIIALDKNKADKLRYKVEDNVVRIFITPYKTSISQEDLEFSQGDFNVDVVIALGVKKQEDLDEAITAHGRILHDATVASINLGSDAGLGTINWQDPQASSLSELVTELAPLLGENLLDNQIATALLTGIVAETDRFSNDKTSSQTMSASSALMAAGANQQLVASKLEEPPQPPENKDEKSSDESAEGNSDDAAKNSDGTLSIDHDKDEKPANNDQSSTQSEEKSESKPPAELPPPQPNNETNQTASTPPVGDHMSEGPQLVTEPPKLGGTLSANTQPEGLDPVTDPMSLPNSEDKQLLDHSNSASAQSSQPAQAPTTDFTPPPPSWNPPANTANNSSSAPTTATPSTLSDRDSETLSEIEKSVNSPHANAAAPAQLDDARDEVSRALSGSDAGATQPPIQALNARPLGDDLRPSPPQPPSASTPTDNTTVLPLGPTPPESSITNPSAQPAPDSLSPSPQVSDPTAPPPVPPPIPFQFGTNSASSAPSNQQNPPL